MQLLQDPKYQLWTPFAGTEHTYFPCRAGNKVTLYKVLTAPRYTLTLLHYWSKNCGQCAVFRNTRNCLHRARVLSAGCRMRTATRFPTSRWIMAVYTGQATAGSTFTTPFVQLSISSTYAVRKWRPLHGSISHGAEHTLGACSRVSHVSEWVAGWSIYTEIKLVRDPSLPNSQTPYPTLGQLLKQKAEEGVTVLLMVPPTLQQCYWQSALPVSLNCDTRNRPVNCKTGSRCMFRSGMIGRTI